MNNSIHFVFRKDLVHRVKIARIRIIEPDLLASQLFNALDDLFTAVVKIIHNNDMVSCIQQLNRSMRTDKPRAAS